MMSIDFRLRSLQIESFRGLKTTEMTFPARAPGVLIGQ